jgi:hypothetical protein
MVMLTVLSISRLYPAITQISLLLYNRHITLRGNLSTLLLQREEWIMKSMKEKLEKTASLWVQNGRGEFGLLSEWEAFAAKCWLFSKGGENDGYSTGERELRFSLKNQIASIPFVTFNNKTIYVLTIDIFTHSESASKRKPPQPAVIAEAELFQTNRLP